MTDQPEQPTGEITDDVVYHAALEGYMADLTASWQGMTPELAQELYPERWEEFTQIATRAQRLLEIHAKNVTAFLG